MNITKDIIDYKTAGTIVITALTICITVFIFHPAISQRQIQNDKDGGSSSSIIVEEILDDEKNQSKSKHEHNNPEQESKSTTIQEQPPPLLSLVIPAYNEELRLPPMLQSTIQHLKSSKMEIVNRCNDIIDHPQSNTSNMMKNITNEENKHLFEIIIINDGSKDNTVTEVKNVLQKNHLLEDTLSKMNISIRLLTLTQNCGKGAAVRVGMLHSHGHLRLMVDADDATNFQPSLLKLLDEMKTMKQNIGNNNSSNAASRNELIVFGSRAHLQESSKAKRSLIRTILMVAFHFFVKTLCSNLIHDTQCGFKLFTSDAAIVLFHNLHLTRWAFDTELVVMAEKLSIPIGEVGVEWEEVDGSKLATSKFALMVASIEMLRDMLCVNIMYTLRLWKLEQKIVRE